jgi:hypothetical protein
VCHRDGRVCLPAALSGGRSAPLSATSLTPPAPPASGSELTGHRQAARRATPARVLAHVAVSATVVELSDYQRGGLPRGGGVSVASTTLLIAPMSMHWAVFRQQPVSCWLIFDTVLNHIAGAIAGTAASSDSSRSGVPSSGAG